ncbi:hypothetical protein GCM10027589_03590 [Actinocorallia lasiicapitis]
MDATALAETTAELHSNRAVHVLSPDPLGRLEIAIDRAIELRNRKERQLLLLVPAGTGHTASSLDNSFEPLPLLTLLASVTDALEKDLLETSAGPVLTQVKRVLGRDLQTEPWARFLSAVVNDPSELSVGRELWRVGLIPDLSGERLAERLPRNAKAVAAIARPARTTSRVIDRLVEAQIKEGEFRRAMTSFLEQQEAGALANPTVWAQAIGERPAADLTFDRWPLVEMQQTSLEQIKVLPFVKPNGQVDPQAKLRQGDDGQLYCDVTPDRPGKIVVKWTTEPAKTSAVASWRIELVPPADLRSIDTPPIAATKAKGTARRTTLSISVTEDDLAEGTLFVVQVRAQDADGNDLGLPDGSVAEAESDQFQVRLDDHAPEPVSRAAGAASLPEAVLVVAVENGGELSESAPVWDADGQLFDLRIGGRRTQVRVSRVITGLQRRLMADPREAVAFEAISPLGEPIDPDQAERRPLEIPSALAEHRRKLLAALASHAPRDVVEVLAWDDDLRTEVSVYVRSYKRALDGGDTSTRSALLRMDTLVLHVGTGSDAVSGLVLLPIHPIRLAWVAAHDRILREWAEELGGAGGDKADRARRVDLAMVSRLSPANLPFVTIDQSGAPYVHAEELTHGSALYLPPDTTEPQSAADVICGAIDVVRVNAHLSIASQTIGERVRSYLDAHPGIGALRIMSVNPGSGAVLARALAPIALPEEPSAQNTQPAEPQRMEIIAYSDRLPYTDPIAVLRELQRTVATSETRRRATHLVPPMGLAARSLARLASDKEGHHLAVVQDLVTGRITGSPAPPDAWTTAFQDLLTPLRAERALDGAAEWHVTPALKPRRSGRIETDMVEAHRSHQKAAAAVLGLTSDVPALSIRLGQADLAQIRAAHRRADWVVTLDRGFGAALFEETTRGTADDGRYLLDYTPDFLEGFDGKITVTTAHHDEVRRILAEAMRKLGLTGDDPSVSLVLNRLLLVSGRLALRLLRETSLSVEAVSLAAVMAHLEQRGRLAGKIVVPVDAHPEIFGARPVQEGSARRCDLLLVQVTRRSLRIECIEVKGRGAAQLPTSLADEIVDQLENTERVLRRQFFMTDPPRLDGALQRTRLAGLLHHYAERSARYGLLPADKLPETHRNIDRIEESVEPPEISMKGFVISPDGTGGFPAKHRNVSIAVLTAEDLGQAGFTTINPAAAPIPPSETTPNETTPPPAEVPRPAEAPAPRSEAEKPPPEEDTPVPSTISVGLGLDTGGVEVSWNISTKGSPHAFILGIPGQGKSVTTRRIIRQFAEQGLPSLILDFHGDMAIDPPPRAQIVDAADGLPFSPFELSSTDPRVIAETAWEVSEIIGYVCGLGEIQRNHVYDGLKRAYETAGGVPDMGLVADQIGKVEQAARGKNARDRLRPLTDFGLFANSPTEAFLSTWSAGMVVDLSRLKLETVQLAAGAFLLRKIYREMFQWGPADALRLAVVLDEAHRLAGDITLPKLMKEGRKYGISVVVASQGSADFHRDVLANAGAKMVFRTNYPESRTTAGFLRGRDGDDLSRPIEQLAVGWAYISTPEHVQARKTAMHNA